MSFNNFKNVENKMKKDKKSNSGHEKSLVAPKTTAEFEKKSNKKFDYFLFPIEEEGIEKTQFKARTSTSERLLVKIVKDKEGKNCISVKGSQKVEITESQIRKWVEMAGTEGFYIEPKKSLSVSIGDLISKK
jgi:hypothetical protein